MRAEGKNTVVMTFGEFVMHFECESILFFLLIHITFIK